MVQARQKRRSRMALRVESEKAKVVEQAVFVRRIETTEASNTIRDAPVIEQGYKSHLRSYLKRVKLVLSLLHHNREFS